MLSLSCTLEILNLAFGGLDLLFRGCRHLTYRIPYVSVLITSRQLFGLDLVTAPRLFEAPMKLLRSRVEEMQSPHAVLGLT